MQFDEEARGFSLKKEGPLDMRMDLREEITAADVVNTFSEEKLGEIFRDFGEESHWKKGARAIVQERKKKKLTTTMQLSRLIERALPIGRKKARRHRATKIFQALRIYVNRELECLKESLGKTLQNLSSKGRLGVLSFHSLEDRIVKTVFKDSSRLINSIDAQAIFSLLTKKPKSPSMEERKRNRRSRSAKLRFIEKK